MVHLHRFDLPLVPRVLDNFFIIGSIIQSIILVLFCCFTTYATTPTNTHYTEGQYGILIDVTVMIFVGFSVLFCLLPRYGWSGISIGILIGALSYEWSFLTDGWIMKQVTGFQAIEVSLTTAAGGLFAAAAVLIATAGVLGRTSLCQLTIMTFFMVPAYSFNHWIVSTKIGIVDTGGTIVIHMFGAFFGFAVSWALGHDKHHTMKRRFDEDGNYETNLFALLGTLFLWCYWPSFVAFEAPIAEDGKFRASMNTQICLVGAAITSILLSDTHDAIKKNMMIHMQTGILAGGVTIGVLADQPIEPWGALLLGIVAGFTCVFGIKFVTPFLEDKLQIHDTCDCMALHGICAWVSVFASCICYQTTASASYEAAKGVANFDGSYQAGIQLAGAFATCGVGLVLGLPTGILMTMFRRDDHWYDESATFVTRKSVVG